MYGAFGGGGGFGQQNQQQPNAFGGAQPAQTGFGSTSTFGQPAGGVFGGAPTAFGGAAQPTAFGAAPATNAFGAAPATSGFGGGGFGGATTGGFGQPQPQTSTFGGGGFGATGSATGAFGGGGFGAAQPAAGGFGSTAFGAKPATTGFGAQPSGFGQAANTGFGAGAATSGFGGVGGQLGGGLGGGLMGGAAGSGTANPPFSAYVEKDPSNGQNSHYQSITAMPQYRNYSFEELRFQDYQQGRKTAGQGGGFGQQTGFGQQPAATGFGAAATPAFGSSSAATPGFGATTGFGAAAGGGFGASSFGQPAATGFGQTAAPAATGFGATPGFGAAAAPAPAFGAQPTNAFGTGAFGAAAPKPTGFGFGAQSTSQPAATGFGSTGFGATGTGLFGGATSAPASGFGAPAAAAAAPTFGGFGATPATSAPSTGLFGLGAAPTFGAAKPATGLSFGAPAASTAPAPSFGGFGTTPASGAGGLFGSTPASTSPFASAPTAGISPFGAQTTSPFGGAQSTGLFGAKAPAAGGLFSQPAATGFGASAPSFGATPSFGASAPALGGFLSGGFAGASAAPAQPSLVASVNQNIYGTNEIFQKDALSSSAKAQPAVLSRTEPQQKLPVMIPNIRITPRHAQIRTRPISSATFSSSLSFSGGQGNAKGIELLDNINNPDLFVNQTFTPRRSVKRLELKPPGSNGTTADQATTSNPARATFNPTLEAAASGALASTRSPFAPSTGTRPMGGLASNTSSLPIKDTTSTHNQTNSLHTSSQQQSSGSDYWMSPSLDELRRMSTNQLRAVPDFKVGRPDFGQVSFKEPVDLTTVASLSSIAGGIVVFGRKVCTVYPDDQTKPARGDGMNVPAIISLDGCWPMDKSTRQPLKDTSSPAYIQHLKRLKSMDQTKFLDFDNSTGTWIFEVQHFSTYGVDNDDDSDMPAANPQGNTVSGIIPALVPSAIAATAGPGLGFNSGSSSIGHEAWLTSRNGNPRASRAMQATLFDEQPSSIFNRSKRSLAQSPPLAARNEGSGAESSRRKVARVGYLMSSESPSAVQSQQLNAQGLLMARSTRVGWGPSGKLAFCGRLFNVEQLGPHEPSSLPTLVPSVLKTGKLRVVADWEVKEVARHIDTLQSQLSFTDITEFGGEVTGHAPQASIAKGTNFKSMVSKLNRSVQSNEEVFMWILGRALFDELPKSAKLAEIDDPVRRDAAEEQFEKIGRRERLSTWLQMVTRNDVHLMLQSAKATGGILAAGNCAFAYLVGHSVTEACAAAVQAKNPRLATLIAQAGNRGSRSLVRLDKQLQDIRVHKMQSHYPDFYLKIYSLLSGDLGANLAPQGQPAKFVTDGMDWRRVLGLHTWYSGKSEATIQDAVESYMLSVANKVSLVSEPSPWYRQQRLAAQWNPNHYPKAYDVLFQLIALSVNPEKSLEDTLNPLGVTPSPFDFRLSWHLYMIIGRSLGKAEFWDPTKGHDGICTSFMFQLESLGLWEWAIFIALHLSTKEQRDAHVQELLMRHVSLDSDCFAGGIDVTTGVGAGILTTGNNSSSNSNNNGTRTTLKSEESRSTEKDKFLEEILKIPVTWIWDARAVKAGYENKLAQQVFSLIKAQRFQEAHQAIVWRVAPLCIINADLTTLWSLLAMLGGDSSESNEGEPKERDTLDTRLEIPGWSAGGKIYQMYLDCWYDTKGNARTSIRSLVPGENAKHREHVQTLLNLLPTLLVQEGTGNENAIGLSAMMDIGSQEQAKIAMQHQICVHEMTAKCTALLRQLSIEGGMDEEESLSSSSGRNIMSGEYLERVLSLAESYD